MEIVVYVLVVILAGAFDWGITRSLIYIGLPASWSKLLATAAVFIMNFAGRKFVVFSESSSGPWRRQEIGRLQAKHDNAKDAI